MIQTGSPASLGASCDGDGVNFALYSATASRVELCLFDPGGTERRLDLPDCDDGVWHGYAPGCQPGQHYGFRVHGPYQPELGYRFNPHKLLLDPYAKRLSGTLTWDDAVFGFDPAVDSDREPSVLDSAPFVPKAVVCAPGSAPRAVRPRIPWREMVIYETNVRGYTMAHPALPAADRGRFAGLANGQVLDYLRALGVTSIELMPVHAFVDERFLVERELRNYWGYNTLSFFAPQSRYASASPAADPVAEFREMVDAIHDAGLEVILDVVYNHTAEGDRRGPTLSFKGIDNLSYYRTQPSAPQHYVNDTGCGNTINTDHPRVQALVCDSLRYWVEQMGVDGFRFDLGSILGRTEAGFDPRHALFARIDDEPALSDVKLIAEPWDVGPGGYQLGHFPPRWSEWNDRFRDTIRRFWRGDDDQTAEFARRLHGSADTFEHGGRSPRASVNFVTSHDGYTLADLVSYEQRHNQANGENNQDGHRHNWSANYGVEGASDDPEIDGLRRRQRLNLLASVLLAQGTPMLLAGDEFGNSQQGNNNAYAQDNETGWLDWSGLERDAAFTEQVRTLIWLRRDNPILRSNVYRHGHRRNHGGQPDIEWLKPDGHYLSDEQWRHDRAVMLLLVETAEVEPGEALAAVIAINAAESAVDFTLPSIEPSGQWHCEFASAPLRPIGTEQFQLRDRSCACFLYRNLA